MTSMGNEQFAPTVLASLKDFQRATAKWAFDRMFDEADPAVKFLVADEVGLGKTHVAKGVIAQVIDHLGRTGDRRHDIVYVCSNGAIARQNMRKLVPYGVKPIESVDRLTMLPAASLEDGHGRVSAINLLAITPGTSLAFGEHAGKFKERAVAYAFLRELWGPSAFNDRGRWVFWHGVSAGSPVDRLKSYERRYSKAVRGRGAELAGVLAEIDRSRVGEGLAPLREVFDELVDGLRWQRQFPKELVPLRSDFMASVRRAMATVGIKMLQPDLVILDEFQRFKDVLDPTRTDWSAELARSLFDFRDPDSGRQTRTLLLSATPYRMYTTPDDVDADHHADFLSTCGFLIGDDERVGRLTRRFRDLRLALTEHGSADLASSACLEIEAELRRVMARTERLAATPDRDGMLVERVVEAPIASADLEAYIRMGDLTEAVRQSEPIEFWKSSPYLINFMENYKVKQVVAEAISAGLLEDPHQLEPGPGLLDWREVERYSAIDPQNGRLRWLLDDLDEHSAFKLLWLPPSLPYWSSGSVYDSDEARRFTKRLVFSGWTVVPKVISSVVSHHAERVAFGPSPRQEYSADYATRGGRRLVFRLAGREPAAMTTFLFIWPSATLAAIDVVPPSDATPSLDQVRSRVREQLRPMVESLTATAPTSGPVDQRWYWATPLLLDLNNYPRAVDDWFGRIEAYDDWTGDTPPTNLRRHMDEAWQLVLEGPEHLGRPPVDLVETMTTVALGGPAVLALRSIASVTGIAVDDPVALASAARSVWGFVSFFNAPDVTALVVGSANADAVDGSEVGERQQPYWRAVMDHCALGNLQAVLDEHVHVLKDWLGYPSLRSSSDRSEAAKAIAEKMVDALDVRTASFTVDVPQSANGRARLDEHRMRTRFAAAFGNQRLEDGGQQRVESVATAFNSPFWPFVMATTSIGQEGLDFHLWCHAVVHWNLPSNPVDLEQREGRVHRYKGHAVRKNLAANGPRPDMLGQGDRWGQLFDAAARERPDDANEMMPYWVFPDGDAKIERLIPVLPFSREAAALPRLKASLANYRLAFGQPRQEELVAFLQARFHGDELATLAGRLRIDLSAPQRPTCCAD
ncbi:MAG: helicase-related protein [Acidimicrobiales bacterium]